VSVLAAATLVGAVACGGGSGKRIALPPVNAGPKQIVAAYVAALNAHDVRTARALLTPTEAKLVENSPDSEFRNVRSITHLSINRPFVDRFDARSLHYRFGVGVGTSFVLDQYKVESQENGPTVLGFTLVRNRPLERWRIGDQGSG
jgi:hypothetical protein